MSFLIPDAGSDLQYFFFNWNYEQKNAKISFL